MSNTKGTAKPPAKKAQDGAPPEVVEEFTRNLGDYAESFKTALRQTISSPKRKSAKAK